MFSDPALSKAGIPGFNRVNFFKSKRRCFNKKNKNIILS